jgi:hypothetical protein
MDFFAKACSFPGSAPIGDATNGWDAIYSVTYSAINAEFEHRKPWMIDFQGAEVGMFDQGASDGTTTLTNAKIAAIALTQGGLGQTVRFALKIETAELDTSSVQTALTDINATVEGSLIFATGPVVGLHTLSVNVASLNVNKVTADPELDDIQTILLKEIFTIFVQAHPDIFSGELASVFTNDYAESVNIPWLAPKSFSYAVTDTKGENGILAVLATTASSVAGLTAAVNPGIFPTNPGLNASIAIGSQFLANETFLAQLNDTLGGTLSSFVYNKVEGTLSNSGTISAFYKIREDNGEVVIVPQSHLADIAGQSFPFSIAPGKMVISIERDAITTKIEEAIVDLGDGYKQIITMTLPFGLVANQASHEIDLEMRGAPIIKSNTVAPASASLKDIGVTILSLGAGIALGEAIGYFGGRFAGAFTGEMTDATLTELTRNTFAAERQLRYEGGRELQDVQGGQAAADPSGDSYIKFPIKGGRFLKLAYSEEDLAIRPGVDLKQEYIDAVTISPTLNEPCVVRDPMPSDEPSDTHVQLLDDTVDGRRVHPVQDLGQQQTNFRVRGTANDFLETMWKQLNGTSRSELTSRLSSADVFPGQGELTAQRIDDIVSDGDQPRLTETRQRALYEVCAKFLDEGVTNRTLSYSIYNQIVYEYPEFTKNPAVSGRSASFSSFGDRIAARGGGRALGPPLAIASSEGPITGARSGMFGDLRLLMTRGRAGTAQLFFRDVILNAPRPLWVKVAGVAGFIAFSVAGYFLGNYVNSKLDGIAGRTDGDAKSQSGSALAFGGASKLLFSSVVFPCMVPISGARASQLPTNVLDCASVNGGLILGFKITLN